MKFSKGDILVPEGNQFPDGAVVVDGHDDAGRLMAHRMGGGFQEYVPLVSESRFRLVDEAERSLKIFRRAMFSLADPEKIFRGWTEGRLWNGWEMPRFEFAVCQHILKSLGDEQARFDEGADAFVTVSNGEEEAWPAEQVTISDGSQVKVYPLGAGSWIWEEG